MRPDGTHERRLTSNPAEDRQPAWSQNGRALLFHSNRAGRFDIFTVPLMGGDERRLTAAPRDTAEACVGVPLVGTRGE